MATILSACAHGPTPYQPLGSQGGYEEMRLQERMYRVTFRGNPDTEPGPVLDMAVLRCAELTRQAGLSHFTLLSRSAEAKLDTMTRSAPEEPMFPSRHMLLGLPRYETMTYVRYHAVTLMMRMLPAEEAQGLPDAFDAADLIRRLAQYRAAGTAP